MILGSGVLPPLEKHLEKCLFLHEEVLDGELDFRVEADGADFDELHSLRVLAVDDFDQDLAADIVNLEVVSAGVVVNFVLLVVDDSEPLIVEIVQLNFLVFVVPYGDVDRRCVKGKQPVLVNFHVELFVLLLEHSFYNSVVHYNFALLLIETSDFILIQ